MGPAAPAQTVVPPFLGSSAILTNIAPAGGSAYAEASLGLDPVTQGGTIRTALLLSVNGGAFSQVALEGASVAVGEPAGAMAAYAYNNPSPRRWQRRCNGTPSARVSARPTARLSATTSRLEPAITETRNAGDLQGGHR